MTEAKRYSQTTSYGKTIAVDKSEMNCGSKKSIKVLLKTLTGKRLYFASFCELWEMYIEKKLTRTEDEAKKFKKYLEEIKEHVNSHA